MKKSKNIMIKKNYKKKVTSLPLSSEKSLVDFYLKLKERTTVANYDIEFQKAFSLIYDDAILLCLTKSFCQFIREKFNVTCYPKAQNIIFRLERKNTPVLLIRRQSYRRLKLKSSSKGKVGQSGIYGGKKIINKPIHNLPREK